MVLCAWPQGTGNVARTCFAGPRPLAIVGEKSRGPTEQVRATVEVAQALLPVPGFGTFCAELATARYLCTGRSACATSPLPTGQESLSYSYLSATMGSTLVARRAGI